MRCKICVVLLFFNLGFLTTAKADSPITSTEFHLAYKDQRMVQRAIQGKGSLSITLMDYLFDKSNPIDVKMAVINAVGWNLSGHENATKYFNYLKEKNNYTSEDDLLLKGDWCELICIAYLKAMDNYFNVENAITFAQKAKKKNSKSYTVNIICAIIESQKAMDKNWCDVYRLANSVRKNKKLNKDMNEEAIRIIFDYMDLYGGDCGK